MKTRKILALLLIAALLTLAGCKAAVKTADRQTPVSSDTESAAPPTTRKPTEEKKESVSAQTDGFIKTADKSEAPMETEAPPPDETASTATEPTKTVEPPEETDSSVPGNTSVETEPKSPEAQPVVPKPVSPVEESKTEPPAPPSTVVMEQLVAQYINQFRLAQGSASTIILPGLTEVARYRAKQLVTNFSHDSDVDPCNVLQYGKFIDMTLYGGKESDSYYRGYNREAICKGNWGGTADEIARNIADGFRNSASHWSYLSSSEYLYMAVGCTYDEATCKWYCCICVSAENYGG